MSTANWIAAFLIAAVTFLLLDLVWLGLVANGFYSRQLGDLKRDSPDWVAAMSFYAIFIAGLLWFCVRPGLDGSGDLGAAALNGAIFGFVAYATFDLTSAAVLRGFPRVLAPVDMAWGTVLSCSVATVTTWVAQRWLA
jgi:uncharacterized membrane protein